MVSGAHNKEVIYDEFSNTVCDYYINHECIYVFMYSQSWYIDWFMIIFMLVILSDTCDGAELCQWANLYPSDSECNTFSYDDCRANLIRIFCLTFISGFSFVWYATWLYNI